MPNTYSRGAAPSCFLYFVGNCRDSTSFPKKCTHLRSGRRYARFIDSANPQRYDPLRQGLPRREIVRAFDICRCTFSRNRICDQNWGTFFAYLQICVYVFPEHRPIARDGTVLCISKCAITRIPRSLLLGYFFLARNVSRFEIRIAVATLFLFCGLLAL